ncbi:unnamed protein product [Gongylonema pulchrum]|uniref:Branchpoint-bridging protein n=1 Tax=Gongylonema pulchrum TaxID=637853 RepID=A0A3P7QIA2_9BILA|nr:unnamed protein product [Gongylonema pulchrum]
MMIPDGQNELRKLQLRELALLNGTLRPEDLASGARCSNCGSDEHKTSVFIVEFVVCIDSSLSHITSIINEALMIPDGQNELRKLQLRELALLNGTLRPEDLASGARCSNCGSDEHKTSVFIAEFVVCIDSSLSHVHNLLVL